MVRRSLLTATLLMVSAAPMSAQEEYVWSGDRPDAQAPLGVMAAHTLPGGAFQVGYRYHQINNRGVWFDNDSLGLALTQAFYRIAPLTMDNLVHQVEVAYGVTDAVTVVARADYSQRTREQFTSEGLFYVTEANGLGDTEVLGLLEFFRENATRAHLQGGVLIPTGDESGEVETPFSTPEREGQPYDMRLGAGVFAFLPGATVQVQNEVASVGVQASGRIYFGENDRAYRPGNRMEGTVWAGYRLNEYFSVSARARYQTWSALSGFDPNLQVFNDGDDEEDPPFYDPGNDGFSMAGSQLDIPVGLNLYMPAGTRLEGHRLAIEYVYPAHRSYDGPQLGFSRGLIVGYHVTF